jgi:transcription initiation factor IIF auxiliary subunit
MSEDMPIKMKNSAEYKGKDRWEWSVWIDGPTERLDEIAYVEYILHPTFAQPVRRVEDRGSQFRLDSRGWGEFMIHASVATHAGKTQRLDHWLRLIDQNRSAGMRVVDVEKPTIFLSYSRVDSRIAEELIRSLEKDNGYEVLSDDQLNSNEPVARSIKSLISRTDALVALIPDEISSQWVLAEIIEALQQQIPVVPVLLGKEAVLPKPLADRQSLRLTDPRNSQEALDLVRNALDELNL